MFVLLVTYQTDEAARAELLPRHHEFLERQYRDGRFLASGQVVSRPGAVILARGTDEPGLRAELGLDPFVAAGFIEYEVIGFRVTRATDPTLLDDPSADARH